MTMAAVMTTHDVADTISRGEAGVMMHGPTFMANPLACSAALASMKLLDCYPGGMEARVATLQEKIGQLIAPAGEFANVADVRVLGSIGVIEMKEPVADIGDFQKKCVERGVWIRPFGRNVYIMPPYVITDSQLEHLCSAMLDIVKTL